MVCSFLKNESTIVSRYLQKMYEGTTFECFNLWREKEDSILTLIWLRLNEFLLLSCVEKLELGVACLLIPTVGVAKGVTWHDWIVDKVDTEDTSSDSSMLFPFPVDFSWKSEEFLESSEFIVDHDSSPVVLIKLSSSTESPSSKLT